MSNRRSRFDSVDADEGHVRDKDDKMLDDEDEEYVRAKDANMSE